MSTKQPQTSPATEEADVDQIDIPGIVELYAPPFGHLANRRQIPDVRDGLLPVRRRILYTMHKMGLNASANTTKSAGVVGETMAKYHPHGDGAIYMAAVNMVQPFSMRYPLIEGQGNFGSINGDPPAAQRYTEMKLTALGDLMVQDLFGPEQSIVPWGPNYDGKLKEPYLLSARFPTLLANGTQGIGWGDYTNMQPHNLRELIDAMCAMIDDPKVEVAKLAKILKAPDYPGGGIIVENDDWHEIMTNGYGKVTVRAKMHIEDAGKGRQQIVVTELPYNVIKSGSSDQSLAAKIADLVNGTEADKKKGATPALAGTVSEVRDESGKDGMRFCIVLDRGVDANRALQLLLLYVKAGNLGAGLQKTYTIDQRVLEGGVPVRLGTRDLMQRYLDYQFEILTKRTQYFLDRAERALDQEEAVIVAKNAAAEIVKMAEAAADTATFRANILKRFRKQLHADDARAERQAEIISDLPIRRLVKLDIAATKERIAKLKAEIAEYKRLLGDRKAMWALLREEMREIRNKFGDDRRTVIDTNIGAEVKSYEEMIPDEPCWVVLSASGLVGRLPEKELRAQKRGGAGAKAAARDDDPIIDIAHASTRDRVWILTDAGNLFGLRVADVDESSRGAKGTNIRRFLSLAEGEMPVKIVAPPTELADDMQLVMATRDGRVERNKLTDYANLTSAGLKAIKLVGDDRIVSASLAKSGQQLLAVSSDGYALRFDIDDVSIQGRGAQGVASQKLGPGATVVSLLPVEADDKRDLAVILSNGKGKRSKLSEYPVKGRASRGQITADMGAAAKKGASGIVFAAPVADTDEVLFITSAGKVIRMSASEIKRQGRATGGVQVVALSSSAKTPESVAGGSVAVGETK